MIDFEKEAQALQADDDSLKTISELARKAKELEKELEDLQSVVDEKKKQHRKMTLKKSCPRLFSAPAWSPSPWLTDQASR
jgi:predicted RNase H-like nuclease (RuvC/YqgF family)